MLPGPCSSIVISQVRWGCGVPSTEAIPMECCVSLGLLFRNVLSAAEFTLKRAGTMQDQLSLPHKAQWQPSDSHLLSSTFQCSVGDAVSPTRCPRSFRSSMTRERRERRRPGVCCCKPRCPSPTWNMLKAWESQRGRFFASSWLMKWRVQGNKKPLVASLICIPQCYLQLCFRVLVRNPSQPTAEGRFSASGSVLGCHELLCVLQQRQEPPQKI